MTSAEKIVKVFRALAQIPSVTGAQILRTSPNQEANQVTVVSSWSQRNLERGKTSKFQQTHVADLSSKKVVGMLPVDISTELMSAVSKSGNYRAVIRDCPAEGSATQRKQYLEIWQSQSLYRNFDLAALEVHGEVYVDDEFGSLEFSPDEKQLLFIAEEKVPKAEPFYKQKPQENKEKEKSSENDAAPKKGEEYTFRQDWGELLVGKHRPIMVVCDIYQEKFHIPVGQPNLSIGQVIWTPDGLGFVGVACEDSPRRLGITYCTNRKSSIFHLTTDGQWRVLSSNDSYTEGLSVRSPRFSPRGDYLIWMERRAGGPHHACLSLVRYDWSRSRNDTVVGVVETSVKTTTGAPFYGLYNQRLPKRCWSSDSRRVVFHTPQNCRNLPFIVNIETRNITEVNMPEVSMPPNMEGKGSLAILDVFDDVVVAAFGSLRMPSTLFVGHLRPTGQEVFSVVWTPLMEAPDAGPVLWGAKVEYLALQHKNDDKVRDFSAIYFGPVDSSEPKGSLPLILCPHGGPNSCFTDDFSLALALMVTLGYGVLLVNFRGSTGQGQDSIDFLLGRIGDTDVKDCQLARDETLKKFPALGASKCVLFGGSHGGFVVAHLSAQYPSDYRAVVARNPVLNVEAMYSLSDIPDWAIVNAVNHQYNFTGTLDKYSLEKMRLCSPLELVSQVKAPTLLMLGKKDLRVPPIPALEYYYALINQGVKTKVHMYDDTHQLSQVPNEMDNVINSLLWFEDNLG